MNKLILNFFVVLFLAGASSCIKDKYDAPPSGGQDPNITVNSTIASLEALYPGAGQNYYINSDLVIEAVVTADDQSGNFYKQVIIQDSTAGITLLLDKSYLYTDYPIGRRLFIKLKGLFLVQYKGLYQIAGGVNPDGTYSGIVAGLLDNYVLKGTYFHSVKPKVVTMAQLNNSYQNQLIELDNVEFQTADAGQPYANATTKASLSRTIQDCNGHKLETYNSGYANFAANITPTGNGKLIAIYSVYTTSGQLLLRDVDTSNINMTGTRCDGSTGGGGGGGGNGIAADIADLRAKYSGSSVTLPQGQTVSGIVISDAGNGNINSKGAIVQDSTGGISLFFSAASGLAVGDKVTVDVSGLSMAPFNNGSLEISTIPVGNITKNGTGTITPRVTTIAQIDANGAAWESTLVKITGATITGSGTTYSGTKTITDASDNMELYTMTGASFASSAFPTTPVSVTGFLSTFSGSPQLQLRSSADVQ